ncbi:hypothetical protein BGZ65_009943 [Modicella reniformis]|uniref:Uncharacterized protein n=1 Tax=Modicella reniformis TaxID=1440133 RepID=A0A9P6SQU0_9FUNG|nr:hypothetical protein BGZ65_009943 [Modicella reniformis]
MARMEAINFATSWLLSRSCRPSALILELAFCVMIFTSLMFIASGIATLIAVMHWAFFIVKMQETLEEHRIDAIIKKRIKEGAWKSRMLEEMEITESASNLVETDGFDNGTSSSAGAGIVIKFLSLLYSTENHPRLFI